MRAVRFDQFQKRPEFASVPAPALPDDGVIITVAAAGLCRSDWHGWMGHDPDISLPHVPGHEFAGTIAAVGKAVSRFAVGDRVTVPFICACGTCSECASGNHQVCPDQRQPGFTDWGAFAEQVAIHHADTNLVRLPDHLGLEAAASLGCRYATSFRALIDQARLKPGEWLAVHGCGGVGLSAIQIAKALGARVIAIDIGEPQLAYAKRLGAELTLDATTTGTVGDAIHEMTGGGVHVSLDALGHQQTLANSILSLRRRGRHVQVGLMLAEQARPQVPMDRIIAHELQIYGSHGMQAHRYDALLAMVLSGAIAPEHLISRRISLDEAPEALAGMDSFTHPGVTVINRF